LVANLEKRGGKLMRLPAVSLMEIDGVRRVVRKHDVIFIPPGAEQALFNTGFTDLTFIVVTSPPEDK
ncbi:MAG TPA: hypothetical protein VK663_02365, partial [Burkholderiales bacterium]|nr:hypothetical protein [Burkholderiales bacterium]